MNEVILLRALESAAKEQNLTDAINAIVAAYYEEYTDATELDPQFYNALRVIWDMCFFTDENSDSESFEQVIQKR